MMRTIKKMRKNDWQLFFLASLGVLFLIIFAYIPMMGLILAFKDGDRELNVLNVIFSSGWLWTENFRNVFSDYFFFDVLWNTLGLNILCVVITFPAPILFALFLEELKSKKFKSIIQSISIFPNFVSWVCFGGIFISMLDMKTGLVNPILEVFGLSSAEHPINLLSSGYIWAVIIIATLIKNTGWGSIIYTAALTRVDITLFEAAEMDGASRLQKMRYISLPSIAPTITVYFLLTVSGILNNSFEQIYVFQNAINLPRSEVLATYLYKVGISQRRYSYSTALGLMQSVVAIILLAGGNAISKKLTGRGMF